MTKISNKTQSVWGKFFKVMLVASKYKYAILVSIVGVIIARLADGAIYKYLMPQLVDEGLVAKEANFLSLMPFLIIGIFLARGFGEFLSKYFMGYTGRCTVRDIRNKILNHFLLVPASFFIKNNSGELISKINYDVEQVSVGISDAILEFFNSIIAITVLLGVMFSISVKVTLLILIAAPVIVGYLKLVGKFMHRYSARVQTTMGSLTHVSSEVIRGAQVIKSFQGQAQEQARINYAISNNCKQELKTILITAMSSPVIQVIGGTVLAMFLYLVTRESVSLTAGEIASLIAVLLAIVQPLKQMSQVNHVFQKALAASSSIHELLEVETEIDTGKLELQDTKGELEFNKVSFKYDIANKNTLEDITFKVKPGQKVALVGHSGGGKSTLVSLISRFFNYTDGSIKIDNININDLSLVSLRDNIALVSQQVILFNDTIVNNVAYGGKKDADLNEVIKALTDAQALEFVDNLPKGINTVIGENGSLLSGGQRQRIAIARAMLKDAPILILDEATSALDVKSERLIKQALDTLMADKTTIIIAHRLSTIENADLILVIDKGKIVASGTHNELLQTSAKYRSLQHELPGIVA